MSEIELYVLALRRLAWLLCECKPSCDSCKSFSAYFEGVSASDKISARDIGISVLIKTKNERFLMGEVTA
jgi:hypothetical protein